jgi:hypothetical protein
MTIEQARDAKTQMETSINIALGEFSRATGVSVRNVFVRTIGDPDDDWRDYTVGSEVQL